MLLPQKTRMQFSRNTFCNYFIYKALSGSKRLRESSSLLFHPAQRLAQIINICWYDCLVESHFLSSSEIYISQLWEDAKTIWVHLSPPIWRERPKRSLEYRGHVTTYSLATFSANTSVVFPTAPSGLRTHSPAAGSAGRWGLTPEILFTNCPGPRGAASSKVKLPAKWRVG